MQSEELSVQKCKSFSFKHALDIDVELASADDVKRATKEYLVFLHPDKAKSVEYRNLCESNTMFSNIARHMQHNEENRSVVYDQVRTGCKLALAVNESPELMMMYAMLNANTVLLDVLEDERVSATSKLVKLVEFANSQTLKLREYIVRHKIGGRFLDENDENPEKFISDWVFSMPTTTHETAFRYIKQEKRDDRLEDATFRKGWCINQCCMCSEMIVDIAYKVPCGCNAWYHRECLFGHWHEKAMESAVDMGNCTVSIKCPVKTCGVSGTSLKFRKIRK